MEQLNTWLAAIESFLWGPPLLILLLGTGAYLTIGLKFMPIRCLGQGFRMLLQGTHHDQKGEGEITPFQALMTALAATIGTGNIAGVATAIFIGGPGAVFWMWVTALVGMASKYAEAVLAVKYREKDDHNIYVGGPMYYIKNGLGENWVWLGTAFALFGAIAAFGIGNTVQSNSVARAIAAVEPGLAVPYWITGLVMAALLSVVIIGGIRRIAKVAESLVPLMALIYILGALLILGLNFEQLPAGFAHIFGDAFTGTAAVGGFAGAGVMIAIQMGVARGLFSNEAGLGSAPIAHAAARTTDPVRQGMVAMLGTFIDTIIVCSMTALVIVTSGVWDSGVTGAELTTQAFNQGLAGGGYIVVFGLVVFAFTTIIGWGYYGERCVEYLLGVRAITPFRVLWVAAVFVGAIADLKLIWTAAGITMALMAIPNLLALILLSPVVFKLTQEYLAK
ncbi:MAG TPA: sodium:alanine symporter family protein [Acidiferrobacteraceae bacterium]|nr:sodium:alanine symporter family protein [Acidiferrobacteraceae bacterium]